MHKLTKISKLFPPFFFHKVNFSTKKLNDFQIDIFNGLHINPLTLPSSSSDLNSMLNNSIPEWQQQKITGIWLKIPNTKLFLLESALSHSFEYHHCEKDYIMMTKWLPKTIPNKIPVYCTHYVGCGGN